MKNYLRLLAAFAVIGIVYIGLWGVRSWRSTGEISDQLFGGALLLGVCFVLALPALIAMAIRKPAEEKPFLSEGWKNL